MFLGCRGVVRIVKQHPGMLLFLTWMAHINMSEHRFPFITHVIVQALNDVDILSTKEAFILARLKTFCECHVIVLAVRPQVSTLNLPLTMPLPYASLIRRIACLFPI